MTTYAMGDQLELIELALVVLEKNEPIKARMPGVGVDVQAAYTAGDALYAAAKARQREQSELEAKIKDSWVTLNVMHGPAWTTYGLHTERAQTAIKKPDLVKLLKLKGASAKGRPKQLREMREFYTELFRYDEALALLGTVSIPRAELEAAQQTVEAMKVREQELVMMESLKQVATRKQKQAFEALELWHKDLIVRAEIACQDEPELMKAFGLDRFKKRKKASAEEEESEQTPDAMAQDLAEIAALEGLA